MLTAPVEDLPARIHSHSIPTRRLSTCSKTIRYLVVVVIVVVGEQVSTDFRQQNPWTSASASHAKDRFSSVALRCDLVKSFFLGFEQQDLLLTPGGGGGGGEEELTTISAITRGSCKGLTSKPSTRVTTMTRMI